MSVEEKSEAVEQTSADEDTPSETAAEQESTADPDTVASGPSVIAKTRGFAITRWKGLLLTAVLAAAAVFTGVLYFTSFRTGQQTDSAAEQVAIDAASTSTVALLSYSPDTLDRDMERARTLMTGEFETYYGKFSAEVVAPAVRERGITASAQVLNAAVMEMAPDSAKVLIFLNQETVSRDRPEPALTASSVVVSMARSDGQWRISALDPV